MKRREFIKQTALAGAAVATGVAFVVSKSDGINMMGAASSGPTCAQIGTSPAITQEQIKAMVRLMREQEIPPDEDGNYHMLAHPDMKIGRIENVRFIQSPTLNTRSIGYKRFIESINTSNYTRGI
jgi:hypothetical protein